MVAGRQSDNEVSTNCWPFFIGSDGRFRGMTDSIDTGGGGYVEGNISSGGDAVSRDKITNIYPEQLSQDQKLNLLVTRMIGDRLRGVVGLIEIVDNISGNIVSLTAAMNEERRQREDLAKTVKHNQEANDSKFSTLTMWVWMMLAVVGLEGVVLIVMALTP
jgi:hypothetical protein